MMFCEKCGSLLVPKKNGNKTTFVCPKCKFKPKKNQEVVIKEQIQLKKEDQIEVVDKQVEILPKTKEECPKCKHKEAFYWTVQTRAGDEAATQFFRCTNCAHTWRKY